MPFHDLEVQHQNHRYEVEAADLPGSFPILEESIVDFEPANGLERREVAELLAIWVRGIQATVPGTTSAEAALNASYELSLDDGEENVGGAVTQDTGDSGVVNQRTLSSDSHAVLYSAEVIAEGGFADSTNGLGGGPWAQTIQDYLDFRTVTGRGPEVGPFQDLHEHIRFDNIGGADISDSLIRLTANYTLFWDVREE